MAPDEPGNRYLRVIAFDDLPDSRVRIVAGAGLDLAIIRFGDEVFAVLNRCTHAGESFARGRGLACQLTCPAHGARFDLRTGACLNGPYQRLTLYPTRIEDGYVEIGPVTGAASR